MATDGSEFPWAVLGGIALLGAAGGAAVWARRRHENPVVPLVPCVAAGVGAMGAWEAGWWAYRRGKRSAVYGQAADAARVLGRPLMVIGAPDSGPTCGYGCGDVTVDLAPSTCPLAIQADITQQTLPFGDNSVVCFVSCVLEYVSDAHAALREITRVSGGYAYFVGVEPWTLAGQVFPGAKRTLPSRLR